MPKSCFRGCMIVSLTTHRIRFDLKSTYLIAARQALFLPTTWFAGLFRDLKVSYLSQWFLMVDLAKAMWTYMQHHNCNIAHLSHHRTPRDYRYLVLISMFHWLGLWQYHNCRSSSVAQGVVGETVHTGPKRLRPMCDPVKWCSFVFAEWVTANWVVRWSSPNSRRIELRLYYSEAILPMHGDMFSWFLLTHKMCAWFQTWKLRCPMSNILVTPHS